MLDLAGLRLSGADLSRARTHRHRRRPRPDRPGAVGSLSDQRRVLPQATKPRSCDASRLKSWTLGTEANGSRLR